MQIEEPLKQKGAIKPLCKQSNPPSKCYSSGCEIQLSDFLRKPISSTQMGLLNQSGATRWFIVF